MEHNGKAVLLIGFGGPTSAEEVRPFLSIVTSGRNIPPSRIEEVAHHYQIVGGRSPYNEIVTKQAQALSSVLKLPVYVGMRNWSPFIAETLRTMRQDRVQEAIGFVLAPHRSEASYDRYIESVRNAQESIGSQVPTIHYVPPWHTHPLFIEAVANQVVKACENLSHEQQKRAYLVFTAHSIPCAMASRSRYAEELHESAHLVAQKLNWQKWLVAYQSRSGPPHEPWLEPDITQVLSSLDTDVAVVMPIGFLCENVEILYDLDVEAREIAQKAGITMVRASAVNDDPLFISMMADVVRQCLAHH